MPTAPTAADLKLREPAFALVDDTTVEYWLADAQTIVATDWIEADYAPAIIAKACHEMAVRGLGASTTGAAALPAGVNRFRSADMDVSISDSVASKSAADGYCSTRYGEDFSRYLRRNVGGARLVGCA